MSDTDHGQEAPPARRPASAGRATAGRSRRWVWLGIVVLVLAVAGFLAWHQGLIGPASTTTAAAATAAPPPAVVVSKPLVKRITEWDEYTGQFTAVDSVELRARVSGYLQAIHFEDGQLVHEGDLLFEIDPRPFQIALASAGVIRPSNACF